MPAQTAQVAAGQEAGRPQPQTTVAGPGHPFISYAQAGCRLQYTSTGNALGGQINQPLVAVPGYIRKFRVRVNTSGGSASANITAQPDAPYSVVSLVQLYDSFGTPLMIAPGYEALRLVSRYSGQHYIGGAATDHANLPSWSPMIVATSAVGAGQGNFTFQTSIPLELAKGVGTLSGANAALLPRLQWTLGGLSTIITTATTAGQTTNPTVEIDVDSEFYWLPEGVNIEPPGLGTTCQWVLQQASPTIGSATTTRVQLPRFGGYISTLIFELRDANGLRCGVTGSAGVGFGTRARIYVDGVPLYDWRDDEWQDDMFSWYGSSNFAGSNTFSATGPLESGVRVLTRKTSLGQMVLGLLDTGETFLSTNPGTLIELEYAPWGTITNTPATLNIIAGLVVPTGALVTGLPEL